MVTLVMTDTKWQRLWVTILTAAVWLTLLAPLPALAEQPLPVLEQIGADFQLTGSGGKPMGRSDFSGKIVMLTFGYTHCPDVCPTTLFAMKRLRVSLGDAAQNLRVVFITLDPERDTQAHLDTYVGYFGDGIVALTGTIAQIRGVTSSYKTFFEKRAAQGASEYIVAHSDFIYLLDGQGRTRAIYHHDEPIEKMAPDIRALLAEG